MSTEQKSKILNYLNKHKNAQKTNAVKWQKIRFTICFKILGSY